MYTFKQAVKDSKEYIERPDNTLLFFKVSKRKDLPKYRELILVVDEVYRMFYKRLLLKGQLVKLYKERKSLDDIILIPDVLARMIIPMLSMFAVCEDYLHPELEELRGLILETMKLIVTYIGVEKVQEENYKQIKNLEM